MPPFAVQAETPPLREDAFGSIRVGDTRILLELIVRAFQDGTTPEAIVQRYSSLKLADVYAVIAYYLRHREEIETYLVRREDQAQGVQRQIENHNGYLSQIRTSLAAARQGQS